MRSQGEEIGRRALPMDRGRTLGRQIIALGLTFGVLAILLQRHRFPQAGPTVRPPASVMSPTQLTRSILQERVGEPDPARVIYCQSELVCGSDVLPRFYRSRHFEPAWIDDDLSLRNAKALLAGLEGAPEEGLVPENYHLDKLKSLLAEVSSSAADPTSVPAESLADFEMLLTDAFLLYSSNLLSGLVNPETIEPEWQIKGRFEDLAGVLERGLKEGGIDEALEFLKPKHDIYQSLKKALRCYQAMERDGAWDPIAEGRTLRKGDRDPRVEVLRERLAFCGDLSADAEDEPDFYDESLESGVKAFQARHGLEADGAVGRKTVAALNVSPRERLRQIIANLERWRWISPELGDRYVLVNIADFTVRVLEGADEVLSMRAVVGENYNQTPVFSNRITYLEFNPYWNIPESIAKKEILVEVKKNPEYLKEKGIRIFRDWSPEPAEVDPAEIDWSGVSEITLSLRFRQDPGPLNALGRVKFMFPNKYDVYLHDTPARELFAKEVRNFSHGCMRIEKPLDLAGYLLRDDPSWTRERIVETIESEGNLIVPLPRPTNIHVLYWTAWMDESGRVNFREDVYGRDAALYRALSEKLPAFGR